jgi:hypothetical protein
MVYEYLCDKKQKLYLKFSIRILRMVVLQENLKFGLVAMSLSIVTRSRACYISCLTQTLRTYCTLQIRTYVSVEHMSRDFCFTVSL